MYLIQVKMGLDFKCMEGTNPTQLQDVANENILSSHLFMNFSKISHLWTDRPGDLDFSLGTPISHHLQPQGFLLNIRPSAEAEKEISPARTLPFRESQKQRFVPRALVCARGENRSHLEPLPISLRNSPWAIWTCWGSHNLPSTLPWV